MSPVLPIIKAGPVDCCTSLSAGGLGFLLRRWLRSVKKMGRERAKSGVFGAPEGFAVGLIGFWWLCFAQRKTSAETQRRKGAEREFLEFGGKKSWVQPILNATE